MTGRVLVVGGTGRLGSLVAATSAAQGRPVRVLTRDRRRATVTDPRIEVVVGDLRDAATLAPALTGVEVVVAAAHGLVGPGRVTPAAVDRDGNANLIAAAGAAGADLVLMSVVGAAVDSPMELFRMKYAAETTLAASGVPATVVRATAFLELWIDILQRTAGRANRPVVFGRGRNPINFVSVRDVAALVERAVGDRSLRGETLSIGGPDNLTFDRLAGLVAAARGGTTTPRHVPRAALRAGAATVGRALPSLGRQLRAALFMDTLDLTFDDHATRQRFPDLPCTSVTDLLPGGTDTKETSSHA